MSRVLVVDDDELLLQLLDQVLRDRGHDPILIGDHFDAIAFDAWPDVEVLVTDLHLAVYGQPSRVTGVDLLRHFRRTYPLVRLGCWTGAGSPLLEEAIAIAHCVVVKPELDELLAFVDGTAA